MSHLRVALIILIKIYLFLNDYIIFRRCELCFIYFYYFIYKSNRLKKKQRNFREVI